MISALRCAQCVHLGEHADHGELVATIIQGWLTEGLLLIHYTISTYSNNDNRLRGISPFNLNDWTVQFNHGHVHGVSSGRTIRSPQEGLNERTNEFNKF